MASTSRRFGGGETTDVRTLERLVGDRRLCLLVLGEGLCTTHALPESGKVSIGRSVQCRIGIDHPTVSRRHAVIEVGERVTVTDLGSSNGTLVNGQRVAANEPVEIRVGDTIHIGDTMVALQHRSAAPRPRRIFTHGQFEALLEDECARGERGGREFALVRLHLERSALDGRAVQSLLLDTLRPGDHVAAYGPDDYELLLSECAGAEAQSLVEEVLAHLRGHGVPASSGTAVWGRDGRSPEALMATACGRIAGDTAGPREDSVVAAIDPVMLRLGELADRVAAGSITILILGETGAGKEVLAERIHQRSPRAARPLLKLSCAALPETLLENELFGHERGAFTDAAQAKPGLLETASGGTVFLDEIGDLPATLQTKLLRVLEEGQVMRVGGLRPRPIDVRFIAATHHDLEIEARRGVFRADLYFRLSGVTLLVPPLRERVAEIGPLAHEFARVACAQLARAPVPALSEEALELLEGYSWPGNVRELRNMIERAVLLCAGDCITAEHLPADKMRTPLADSQICPLPVAPPKTATLRDRQTEHERRVIVETLVRCRGNQSLAARELGIARRTLIRRLETYELPRPRKR